MRRKETLRRRLDGCIGAGSDRQAYAIALRRHRKTGKPQAVYFDPDPIDRELPYAIVTDDPESEAWFLGAMPVFVAD